MPQSPQNDPVLKRFRAELDKLYGDRIERVVLFGSRARGDAREDSDYDVAVFLTNYTNLWDELGVMAPIMAELSAENDTLISAKPFSAGAYKARTLFMHEVRQEGIDI